jgi:hypothetical protein
MASTAEEDRLLGTVIYEILREAQDNNMKECRAKIRHAFFRQVSIRVNDTIVPAFSREISELGIGLLHHAKLTPCEAEVTIPTEQGYSVRMRTRILWCSPFAEGWYMSGGHFTGLAGINAQTVPAAT